MRWTSYLFIYFFCNIQGRDTPSPGDTPYLCRQRNSAASFNNRVQELSEMESGHLLASSTPCAVQVT
jgi:hypothetical protein